MALFVNNIAVDISNLPADTTLLQYLRQQQQLTGTKEGCGSGDCGACTVMVVDSSGQKPKVKAVNSCICPVASLDNHHVITVEGLDNPSSDSLHPVQEAMVECHGSQCGFCTPGFVMSMATLQAARPDLSTARLEQQRQAVLDAISGNLCRCTGYRPIVEAGCQSLQKPVQLDSIVHNNESAAPFSCTNTVQNADQSYFQPSNEAELQAVLSQYPEARLIAGGTDLMLEVTQGFRAIEQFIDISRVSELNQVQSKDGALLIGAAVTLADLEVALKDLSPEFVALLHRLGSRQIRNRGTVGGNICNASPIADSPPFLLVMEAVLHIANSQGERRSIPIEAFYQGYKQTALEADEYLAAIEVSLDALKQPLRLYKVSKRYEDDISAVMGAFTIKPDGKILMAFGGMAATPARAYQTEAILNSAPRLENTADSEVNAQALSTLEKEFTPMTDVRASASYRSRLAVNLLRKAMIELTTDTAVVGVFADA